MGSLYDILLSAYLVFAAFGIIVLLGKVSSDMRQKRRSGEFGLKDAFWFLVSCAGIGTVLGFGFRVWKFLLFLFGL